MLTKADAKVGNRVKWQSLDKTITAYGTITRVKDDGEVSIDYDDGEEGSTYINSCASHVFPVTI